MRCPKSHAHDSTASFVEAKDGSSSQNDLPAQRQAEARRYSESPAILKAGVDDRDPLDLDQLIGVPEQRDAQQSAGCPTEPRRDDVPDTNLVRTIRAHDEHCRLQQSIRSDVVLSQTAIRFSTVRAAWRSPGATTRPSDQADTLQR